MKSKDKPKKYKVLFSIIILIIIFVYAILSVKNNKYVEAASLEEVKISNASQINLEEIINKNTSDCEREEIIQEEIDLEYITTYNVNKQLPKGEIKVIQEGRNGKQTITTKVIYKNGEETSRTQIEDKITKASVNKIVEVGGANYTNKYKIKIGDLLYVTSDRLSVMLDANEESVKVTTLARNDEMKLLEIHDNWYRISSKGITGWVKKENTTCKNSNVEENQSSANGLNKQQLVAKLNFDMALNKPSGLTLEQFKKILNDDKDKNKIFSNNAQYFYYIEKQYNINGVFVAAVGIHESAWGTSKIALNKNNLFGYGAYDSNPYNSAYSFSNYSESIDLISRVFVKYYINPKGTKIYESEVALGTYYSGNNLTSINKKYASDKNWANGVYKHMQYLYNKL